MSINHTTKNLELFFSHFLQVIERNDAQEAEKVAQRIKTIFGAQPVNAQDTPPFTIAAFHQRIINILDKTDNLAAAKMRRVLANYYFKHCIQYLTGKPVSLNWYSEREINEKFPDRNAKAYYFHATSLQGIAGILLLGKVLVQANKLYRGAFVTEDEPAWDYGPYALVFNKCIERASPLSTLTFDNEELVPYIGFARPINVNKDTLSHIIVDTGRAAVSPTALKIFSKILTGRDILVVNKGQAPKPCGGRGTPIEWFGNKDYGNRSLDSKEYPNQQWRDSPFLPSRL